MTHRRKNTDRSEKKRWPFLLLAALLVSAAIIAVLFFGFAALMMKVDLPETAVKALGMVIPGITGIVSGFTLARMEKNKGLLVGLLSCLPAAVFFLVSNLVVHPGVFSISILLKLLILFICGAMGGIFGVNMRKRIKV